MKIAFLLPNLESGGTERQVLSLARLLDRSRFSPFLVATAGGGALHREFSGLMPVTVFGDPGRAKETRTSLWEHAIAVRRLAGIFRRERPDILHACLPSSNVLGPVAARLAGVRRVIVSKRSLSGYKDTYPVLRRVEPLGNLLADVVLVNSDAVRRDIEKTERFFSGKVRKIYNGVAVPPSWTPDEAGRFRACEGIPPGSRVVLSVANFFPYKGHLDLIEAASLVVAGLPETLFLFAGRDAGIMERCRARVRELGIDRQVRFLGGRTDVTDLLRASDLFVHPSHEEGFSNAVLEAMAAGRAVVATGVGGVPEAVADGETGLLVPPRNPGALAGALLSLLRDPGRVRRMGEAGRARVLERHAMDRMVVEVEGLYERLCGGSALS